MRGVESAPGPGVVTMMAKGKAHVARRSIPAHCRRQTKASLLRRSASGRGSCRARLNCTRPGTPTQDPTRPLRLTRRRGACGPTVRLGVRGGILGALCAKLRQATVISA
jgi:hypothetical protein